MFFAFSEEFWEGARCSEKKKTRPTAQRKQYKQGLREGEREREKGGGGGGGRDYISEFEAADSTKLCHERNSHNVREMFVARKARMRRLQVAYTADDSSLIFI